MDATEDRLRGLVDAGIALTSNLSLDAVLQKLVETAADLTGARYAARRSACTTSATTTAPSASRPGIPR